ncbi:TPA: glycosyltransferase family 2 protein, partial [Streptococcus pneumoniae]|nr:glycosyltransferase family 2 protein [Streptococcus pneumoniae]
FNERILVTKKYYSLNIKRLLLIGDKCKALKVIKKAREEKIFNEFLFLKYMLLYYFGFFYCIYDNYVQLKFRK